MEGAGSRLSRASSRYGPATTVFSGPVRRWKKKWVHVPPSPSSVSSRSQSNGRNNDNTSRLLLCRWTPISPTTNSATAEPNSAGATEEPPRRKFRYTPVSEPATCICISMFVSVCVCIFRLFWGLWKLRVLGVWLKTN